MTHPELPRHPTPPHPAPADVACAMDAALARDGSSAELERIVRAYVRALKNTDVPPEQALKRVKDLVGLSRVTPIGGRGAQPPDQFAGDVVAWFVAEYYREN